MSKKFLKAVLPFLLAALLAFTVAGCGSSSGAAAENLEGTYTAGVDMRESLSESSGLDIKTDLVMHLILTISSGKNYNMELDVDQFVADTKVYYETEMPSLIKQGLINEGYTEEQIDEVVKQQGYASFDEFAEANLNIMLEEFEAQYENSEPTLSKGTYTVDGQKISLKDESGKTAAEGTVGSDGSLTFELTLDGRQHTAVFTKQ